MRQILNVFLGQKISNIAILFLVGISAHSGAVDMGPIVYKGTLAVIGHGAGSPDDLAVDADDTIYFSDMATNKVLRLKVDGRYEPVVPVQVSVTTR